MRRSLRVSLWGGAARRAVGVSVLALTAVLAACGGSADRAGEPTVGGERQTSTIVVYGATGNIGSLIVDEALVRGHRVIGVSRNPEAITRQHERFQRVAGDVTDVESVTQIVRDVDVVIVSVQGNAPSNEPLETTHARAAATLVQALRRIGNSAPRVIQVGGATTLVPDRSGMLAALPPPAQEGTPLRSMLMGHWEALETYRAAGDVRWTVATPATTIQPGERTGSYRVATDELVTDAEGVSRISREDFAVAIVDEVENPRFVRQRFTLGY